MASFPKLRQPYIWPLLVLIPANLLLMVNLASASNYIAALLLLAFLPGWVWLAVFFDHSIELGERLLLSIGLSLALTIFCMILAVYWPGPLTVNHPLVIIDFTIISGLVALWRRRPSDLPLVGRQSSVEPIVPSGDGELGLSAGPPRQAVLPAEASTPAPAFLWSLLALLLLAALLRLPRLGYAEFHEDEAEALMLGVRLLQGEDYALFLHRKGPAQMLLPVAFWQLTGQIDEKLARFPFALSSLLSVATLFFIGRRWFNRQAGLIAGLLWAINGYAIGFGRMVQYQALIFFLGPLALYCLYLARLYRRFYWQMLAAIFLAACLLAHFDALLLLPAAVYLGWKGRGWGLPLLLLLALLASFYVPYMLDPEFHHTIAYLAEARVGPGLLYNNLDLLRRLDRDYSSHFYLPALVFGLIAYLGQQNLKLQRKWQWLAVGLFLASASTFWLPGRWQAGLLSLAVIPWLLLGLICFWGAPTVEVKAAWLMFEAALIGYVFLVSDPRTHLYMLYPGAILLAGAGWAALVSYQASRYFIVALAGAIILYEAMIFLQPESGFSNLRRQWDGSVWEIIYNDLPQARAYFGYPKREGWKAIGALRAQGLFPGDFRSANEDFVIPIWYNYGQPRSCYDTPAQFFVRATAINKPASPADSHYTETAQIWREGEMRLQIFSAGVTPQPEPAIYSVEALAERFDRLATPGQFTRQAEPDQWVGAQFGTVINFVGYDLPAAAVAAGDTLSLTLYWQALQAPGKRYRAFAHLTDGVKLWAQQDDDPACRLPTSLWRASQHGAGQFRLLVDPKTPPGRYPLIIGLYQAETLERLKITGGADKVGDDFLWLGDIEVTRLERE